MAEHAPGCLSTAQAAEALGIAPSTLRNWINSGARPEPGWIKTGRRRERTYCERWMRDTRDWMSQ